jgi:BMFP domain-containing protein YqiC
MKQLEFPARSPFFVPPGDFARPGLVDAAFVARSVAAMRELPDAEKQLRQGMAERLESIRAIDLVYREELNQWAATTRERLWLEYFTAETILTQLNSAAGGARAKRPGTTPSAAAR